MSDCCSSLAKKWPVKSNIWENFQFTANCLGPHQDEIATVEMRARADVHSFILDKFLSLLLILNKTLIMENFVSTYIKPITGQMTLYIRLLSCQDFDMHNSQLLGNYNDYEGHEENFQITFLRLLQYRTAASSVLTQEKKSIKLNGLLSLMGPEFSSSQRSKP